MTVSPFQIHNVLRTYNDVLRFHKLSSKEKTEDSHLPEDKVTISKEGKDKQIAKDKGVNK
ncbi:MAG: hypothetical protein ACE5EA_09335 [Nitrospirota bacterium]